MRRDVQDTLAALGAPSMADPPFACPPDIVLDLPAPPSVNRMRKVDWSRRAKHKSWLRDADTLTLAAKCRTRDSIAGRKIPGTFEAIITLSEHHTRIDLDNGVKCILDYAKRVELITDDGPKYLRRLTVEWGTAATGCRLVLRPMAPPQPAFSARTPVSMVSQ